MQKNNFCIHQPTLNIIYKKAIEETVDVCLKDSGLSKNQLSAIAVTVGPGLGMCLGVGVRKAYKLAAELQIPVVRIHHMEAHAMVTRMPSLLKIMADKAKVYSYSFKLLYGNKL